MNFAVLTVALVAGTASSLVYAEESPTKLDANQANIHQVAHIYYNISTDERVVTVLGDSQTQGADNGISGPIWTSLVGNQCAAQGFSSGMYFAIDAPTSSGDFVSGYTLVDWAEIELDTVVDCVHINWVTDHDDSDLNSDGIGDGVDGLAGQWTFFDADNGRAIDGSTRLPVISFTFTQLPGDTTPSEDGFLAGYSADVDLGVAFGSSSLVFEFGDSDGDLQGATFGNNDIDTDSDGIGDGVSVANLDRNFDGNPDGDLDGDGLFDWSWGVRFYQPGTTDFDGDGILDGDAADGDRVIGINFGAPEGEAIDNGDGTWTWEIDSTLPDAGVGAEDQFALYLGTVHQGVFFLGGFSCEANPNGQYTPSAMFAQQLFGPSSTVMDGCNLADLAEPFGELNFFDVSAFLSAFSAQDSAADLAEPQGVFNFFDVSAFLSLYGSGCP